MTDSRLSVPELTNGRYIVHEFFLLLAVVLKGATVQAAVWRQCCTCQIGNSPIQIEKYTTGLITRVIAQKRNSGYWVVSRPVQEGGGLADPGGVTRNLSRLCRNDRGTGTTR